MFLFIVVPEVVLNPKKKVWETVQPELKTNSKLVAVYQDKPLKTEHGEITVKSLMGANIK
jgi:methionyl-tRNA synthetase